MMVVVTLFTDTMFSKYLVKGLLVNKKCCNAVVRGENSYQNHRVFLLER